MLSGCPFNCSTATWEWIFAIFPQYKLDFAIHVFIVNRFTLFKVDTTSNLLFITMKGRILVREFPFKSRGITYLIWLFIVTCATELVKDFLLAQNTIQKPASFFHIVILHKHGACQELSVSHGSEIIVLFYYLYYLCFLIY